MFIKAAREHLKARFAEWVTGLGLFAWGIIALLKPGYFMTVPALASMAHLAPQEVWGWGAVLIGVTRLVFLTINGTWRRSAHLRAIGSGLSATFWAAVLGSYMTLGHLIPNLATISILLCLDIYSLWFAAEDAGKSDIRTKEDKAIVREVRSRISDST